MSVALDAKSSWTTSHNAAASYTDNSFTVGSGANRALVVCLACESSGTNPTAPTANWDSTGTNQSMTLITAATITDTRQSHGITVFFFGLVAPTSGLKTLSIGGLNTSCDSFVSYISFTGVDQTGGTTTFKNATTNITGSGTSLSAVVTTNSGDAAIGAFSGNNGTPTINQTAWATAALTGFSTDYHISAYAISAASSVTFTLTQSTANCNYTAIAIKQAISVAVDATGTALIGTSSVSTINYTGITVGSSLSNGALIATLVLGTASLVSNPTAVWDSGVTNQSMTLLGTKTLGAAGSVAYVAIFGLRNPISGNKTLKFSWTGANFPVCEAISFTGVDQTSDATAFKNFNSASISQTGGTLSTTITSAIGDMVVGLTATNGTISSINNTQIYLNTTSSGDDSAACRAAGASTVTITGTFSGTSLNDVICGIDISAAGAAAAVIEAQLSFIGRTRSNPINMLQMLRQNVPSDAPLVAVIEAEPSFIGRTRSNQINVLQMLLQNVPNDVQPVAPTEGGAEPTFVGKTIPIQINVLPLLRQNLPTDTQGPLGPQVEQEPSFVGRLRPLLLNYLRLMRENLPTDTQGPLGPQVEAQPHFIGRFALRPYTLTLGLRQNVPDDVTVLEAQPHFVGRTKPQVISLLPALRQHSSPDFGPLGPQVEAQPHFIGRFALQPYTLTLGLRQNVPNDATVQTIVEAQPHFVGRLVQQIINLLPSLRQHASLDFGPLGFQVEAQPHFVGRFSLQPYTLTLGLRQNTPNDSTVQPILEAQPHFVGRLVQQAINLLPSLRQNTPNDDRQVESQPHFVGRFVRQVISLLPLLRQHSSIDLPVLDVSNNFIGKTAIAPMNLLPLLRSNPGTVLPAVNDNPVNFLGTLRPTKVTVLTQYRQNTANDTSSPTSQVEAQPHFVGRFVQGFINLLSLLRFNPAQDIVIKVRRSPGKAYTVVGMSAYYVVGTTTYYVAGTTAKMKIHDPLDFFCNTSWQIQGPILDANYMPINLTNVSFSWRLDSVDGSTNFIMLQLGSGVSVIDPVNSIVLIDVPNALNANLLPGLYRDVLVATTGFGDPITVWSGIIRAKAALA